MLFPRGQAFFDFAGASPGHPDIFGALAMRIVRPSACSPWSMQISLTNSDEGRTTFFDFCTRRVDVQLLLTSRVGCV
jgi:hypothetical protein